LPCTLLKPCLCLCLCCHRSVPVRCTVHSRAREYVLVHVNRMLAIPGKDAKEGGSGKSRSQAVRCDSQPRRQALRCTLQVRHQHYEAVRADARRHAGTYAGAAAQADVRSRAGRIKYRLETERPPTGASQDMTTRDHIPLSAVRCDSDMDTHDYGTRRARGGYSDTGSTRGATTRGARGGYSDTGSTG
jgi:hypothetical protein